LGAFGDLCCLDQLEPKDAFVGFFDNETDLRNESLDESVLWKQIGNLFQLAFLSEIVLRNIMGQS